MEATAYKNLVWVNYIFTLLLEFFILPAYLFVNILIIF